MPLSHKKTRIQAFDRVNGVNGNAGNAGIPRRYLFSARASLVAQICNLLYRRIAFCRAMEMPGVPGLWRDSQNAILRYSRLKICATKVGGKTHTRDVSSTRRQDAGAPRPKSRCKGADDAEEFLRRCRIVVMDH